MGSTPQVQLLEDSAFALNHRIEAHLARMVREYLRTRDPAHQAEISAGLERLLQQEWEAHGHSPYRWFDGLAGERDVFRVRKGGRLQIVGLMTWGKKGRGEQWVELFSAELRVVADADQLLDYTLRLGRRGREDRRVPYEALRVLIPELEAPASWDWAWVFRKASP